MQFTRRLAVAATLGLALFAPSAAPSLADDSTPAPASTAACPWVSSTAPVAQRVEQLMAAMSQSDKIAMVHGTAGTLQPYGPTYAGQVSANPRLCIPALSPSDGPAGVGNDKTGVTQLPAPITLGATWDVALARRYGEVIGAENRGKGSDMALGPGLDIARDPRAGRFFEDLGEDPELIAELAAQETVGIRSQGVLATAKHLAAYTRETGRNTDQGNVSVDERTLQELYLAPYEPVVGAGVDAVMCGYGEVNGVHSCNDSYTMTQVVKGQMGFEGFTVSDWFGMHATVASANAGLDLQMPDACYYGTRLPTAISQGLVPASRLDDMVRRILTRMFLAGLFDHSVTGSPDARVTNDEHAALSDEVASQGSVLMRNRGVLPLGEATRSIAVIGSAAGHNAIGSGGGSAHVVADRIITPLQGIAAEAKTHGVSVTSYLGALPDVAARSAAAADVAVVVVSKLSSESKDAGDLQLSLTDRLVLDAVTKANPNTVVVVNTGAPVDLTPAATANAVLWMGYPGQSFGRSLAGILWGRTNPSGRLPVSWPASQSQLPGADESLAVGYRRYAQLQQQPLCVFGSGLSYTTFAYSDLSIGEQAADGSFPVQLSVRNTGARAGAVVPQVYLDQAPSAPATPRALKAFTKVILAPGESRRVSLTLTARDLSYFDVDQHRWILPAGDHAVLAGDNAVDLPLRGTIHVESTTPTSRATPPAPAGAPTGNENADESFKDAMVCGNGGFMAGGVGLASYFGLAPQRQAVIAPGDSTQG